MSGAEKNKHRPTARTSTAQEVEVWDLVVRIGHWTMLAAFAVAYLRFRKFPLHAIMGYTILGIVLWRVVWGFVGSRYARFSAFTYSPRETLSYTLSALKMGAAKEYTSHNPMGALMVFAMLPTLLATGALGILLYSAQQLSGPLGELVPTRWEDPLQAAHAFFANFALALAILHFAGVVWASWWHRENYIGAMITGRKPAQARRAKRTSAADRKRAD